VKTLTACAVAKLGALGICVYTVLYCSTKTTRFILDLEVLLVFGKDVRDFLLPVRCFLPLTLGHGADRDTDVRKELVPLMRWVSDSRRTVAAKQTVQHNQRMDCRLQLFDACRYRGRTIRRRAREWAN